MAKKLTIAELVETHKPKNVKYKYIINDDKVYDELVALDYDLSTLDTIDNNELVAAALSSDFVMTFDRTTVSKATEPTILDNGVILSKNLITKADKKLLSIQTSEFVFNSIKHIALKFNYKYFSILEIFILT